jgi:hypothetical protein
LIEVKRAAGRPKDLEAIAELEQILEEGRQGSYANVVRSMHEEAFCPR